MRTSIYLTLALAAIGYVQAENIFDIAQDEENQQNLTAEADPRQRMLQRRSCQWPTRCYWNSRYYRMQTADKKMDDLWRALTRNGRIDDEPIGIWFDKFPNFFEQEAIRSFKNNSDIMEEGRAKIVHN